LAPPPILWRLGALKQANRARVASAVVFEGDRQADWLATLRRIGSRPYRIAGQNPATTLFNNMEICTKNPRGDLRGERVALGASQRRRAHTSVSQLAQAHWGYRVK
jgi:hypothetical protein